ncbi:MULTISPECIES: c-type cytochrome [Meridianimarinicoccus]|uniref:c-type cytochrome n=1 Tax=Meridianimarinicoccus zhengii TaxID=2056810 RepID=UPI000DAD31DB|nr:c-type cytochrome [Phycocomes zhengii]
MLDTMTLTKVVGAFCGALLVYLLGGWVGEALYHGGHGAHEQAYVIDTGSDEGGEEAVEEEVNMVELVAAADAGAGERVFRACAACHKIDEPANGVGPHLDGVMGREIASIGDFNYSGALPAGEVWNIDRMSAWIENPSGFAEGTSMNYRGLSDNEDRADLIAYLVSKSPDFTMPAEDANAGETAAPEEAALETESASADDATEETPAPEAEAEETEASTETAAASDADEAPAEGETSADASGAEAADETSDTAEASGQDAAPEEDSSGADEAAPAEETQSAEAPAEDAAAETTEASPFVAAYEEADAAAGERVFRQCQACHVADKEQNRVGPHLVDIVGRTIGAVDGFRYSGALPEGEWTLDNLNAWLENPRDFAQGTSMSYTGLRDMQDRANVIAYIESLN